MINFFDLNIKRTAVHRLIAKEPGQPYAQIIESENLLNLDENVAYTILERLSNASEKKNKTFNLSIADTADSSFFGFAKEFSVLNDQSFLSHSVKISQKLAIAQTSARLPGGYVIVIDAEKNNSKNRVAIVIKAELHDALIFYQDSLRLLEDVFLSPSQKLFKFGVLHEYDEHEKVELHVNLEYPNDSWGGMLYDEQFRVESKPAEYFYKDFLGFGTERNGEIQSKRFYDKTENFIKNYYEDYVEKKEMLSKLNDTFTKEESQELSANEFSNKLIGSDELKKQYDNEVSSKMPEIIKKNPSLIRNSLVSKRINFPGNVKITGPAENIDSNVEIIDSDEDLKNISTMSSSYTIIKIAGKPFSKSSE